MAIMLHRTTRGPAPGTRACRRECAEKRLRGAMPVITACNGWAARAPAQCDAGTRRRARLCGLRSAVPRIFGRFRWKSQVIDRINLAEK